MIAKKTQMIAKKGGARPGHHLLNPPLMSIWLLLLYVKKLHIDVKWRLILKNFIYLSIYLRCYLTTMFTIVKKLIYIDNKKQNKMKTFKLIKWVDAGRIDVK